MTDDTTQPPPENPDADTDTKELAWDPRQVMRDRAAATRAVRDESIADLRAVLDDEEILDEFGINLDGVES